MAGSDKNTSVYDSILNEVLESELDVYGRFDYTVISYFYKESLSLAKKGLLHQSKYYLDKGDILTEAISDPTLSEWLQLFYLPKKAFYHFRKKDFKNAGALTLASLELCRVAEDRGFDFVFHARIQQTFNLARIYMNSADMDTGLTQCSQCLVELFARYQTVNDDQNEDLLIRNMYQIILKALDTILKAAEKCQLAASKWLATLLGSTMAIPGLLVQSQDQSKNNKFRELITFIGLFNFWIDQDYVSFANHAAEKCPALIQDSYLNATLNAYLEIIPG